jgi:G3E family GTPase
MIRTNMEIIIKSREAGVAKVARTPLVVVAGLASDAVADGFADPDTLVLRHDLSRLDSGVLSRQVRRGSRSRTTEVELGHSCVSCVLRAELLPQLLRSAGTPGVLRVVLRLDPALEPETVCWALGQLAVEGRLVAEVVQVQAVVTVLDAASWLSDVTGATSLVQRGLAVGARDDRSVAQVAVGQVEFADAVVVAGAAPDVETARRTDAVLDRLAPAAPRVRAGQLDVEALLATLPPGRRRGRVDDAHAVLTHRAHPRHAEHGIGTVFFGARRPFHPRRLHDTLDVLLEGVVRARGRIWVASQPDEVLAVESAGHQVRVAHAGPWLGAVADWSAIPVERALMASLRWDDRFEDREQALVVVYHSADPETIIAALDAALLTDDELDEGHEQWRRWPDPFGAFHADPCGPAGLADVREDERGRGLR